MYLKVIEPIFEELDSGMKKILLFVFDFKNIALLLESNNQENYSWVLYLKVVHRDNLIMRQHFHNFNTFYLMQLLAVGL